MGARPRAPSTHQSSPAICICLSLALPLKRMSRSLSKTTTTTIGGGQPTCGLARPHGRGRLEHAGVLRDDRQIR